MKKINSIMLIIIMIFSLVFSTTTLVYAEDDTREIVSEIKAESNNIDSIPIYGGKLAEPTIEVIEEENPAYFNTDNGYWQKKTIDGWEDVNKTEVFRAGIWRYRCNVYIDTTPEHNNNIQNGKTHRLADKIKVIVNENEWTTEDSVIGSDFSYAKVYSKKYEIQEPETLTVYDSEELDIGKNKATIPIKEFSVSNCVEGGTKPYTYTKKSGPDWINVSEDGIVSGTPKIDGKNEDLVIQISDSSDEVQIKSLTISVANTDISPNLRENITEIVAKSENINDIPKNGVMLNQPKITVTNNENVSFITKDVTWQKRKIDEQEWTTYQPPEEFSTGIWRYSCIIEVKNTVADKYKLYDGTKVIVNGEEWIIDDVKAGDGYSSANVYSNEYYISENGTYIVTFNTNNGSFIEGQIVQANNKVSKPNNPTREGYVFEGWYADKDLKKIFDFNTETITSHTIIYAKWHKHDLKCMEGKAATCINTGIEKHYKCSTCNKLFKDEKGLQEITENQTILPKIPHSYKDEVISKEKTKATLTKNGKIIRTIQTKCSYCGEISGTRTTKEKIYYAKTIKLSKTSFKYNKNKQKPTVIVKDSKGNTIDESNYTVTYSNKKSKKVGEYTVTIKFKNKYKGKKELKYTIKPQGTIIRKLKAGSKQIKAIWEKNKEQTSGYQIKISTNKKFTKNIEKITVQKNKITSWIIKKLKSKKNYFVKIRTYKTVNGKRIYSSWSESKTVKTKK